MVDSWEKRGGQFRQLTDEVCTDRQKRKACCLNFSYECMKFPQKIYFQNFWKTSDFWKIISNIFVLEYRDFYFKLSSTCAGVGLLYCFFASGKSIACVRRVCCVMKITYHWLIISSWKIYMKHILFLPKEHQNNECQRYLRLLISVFKSDLNVSSKSFP